MKRVVVRAPLLSKSGYGVHSRQLFKYLLTKPNLEVVTQVVPWGNTPWALGEKSYDGLASEVVKRADSGQGGQKNDISFQIQLPNEWDASVADVNIGVTAAVETNTANPLWTSVHCTKMDLVIVPSQHTKNALTNAGTSSTDIRVVPESYFPELTKQPGNLDLPLATKFNFLTVGVLTGMTPETDRKNLFYLIKWFIEEFKNDKDVGLIVKTCRGRESTIDRELTRRMFKQLLRECGHESFPRIYLLHGDMKREEMNSLYKDPSVKALLSCTRGEGFGLPLLEAAVAGLPVIATGWSAHTEFLNKGKWLSLDYDLKPVHKSRLDNEIFVPGAKWAEVKENSFKKVVRKFKQSHITPKTWANDLSDVLTTEYSEKSIFKKYDEVLGGILI